MPISIGAVWFEPYKIGDDSIRSEFHILIDPDSCAKVGLRMTTETIGWWMDPQRREALDQWRGTPHFELAVALDGFAMWLQECLKAAESDSLDAGPLDPKRDTYEPYEQIILWGNGPQFDCMLLRQAYEVTGRALPWMHFNERCFRTMKTLPGAKLLAPPHEGLQHNALVNARQQAKWLCNILAAMERGEIKASMRDFVRALQPQPVTATLDPEVG